MVLNKHQHKLEQNKKTVYYIKHPISNRPHSTSARPGLCPKIQGITLSGMGQSKLGVTKSFRNLRIIFGDPEQIVRSGGNCTVKSGGNKTFVCIAFDCLTSSCQFLLGFYLVLSYLVLQTFRKMSNILGKRRTKQ